MANTMTNFTPDSWAATVMAAMQAQLVMGNLVNTTYTADAVYGSNVQIPNPSVLTVNDMGAEVTVQDLSASLITIPINKWKESSFAVGDKEALQAKYDLRAIYAPRQGYAIAEGIEKALFTVANTLTAGQTIGDGTADITEADILAAKTKLDLANAPQEGRFLVLHPNQYNLLLSLGSGKFVTTLASAGDANPLLNGEIKKAYGFTIFMSNNVPVAASKYSNFAFHRDAFALVMQQAPRAQSDYEVSKLRTLFVSDVVFGAEKINNSFGVKILTK